MELLSCDFVQLSCFCILRFILVYCFRYVCSCLLLLKRTSAYTHTYHTHTHIYDVYKYIHTHIYAGPHTRTHHIYIVCRYPFVVVILHMFYYGCACHGAGYFHSINTSLYVEEDSYIGLASKLYRLMSFVSETKL